MTKNLHYTKNQITFGGVTKIFPDAIHVAFETSLGLLVMFKYDRLTKQNISMLNDRLEEVWKIQEANPVMEYCPYTSLTYRDGRYMAFNSLGVDCEIDLKSGKILNAVFTK